MDEEVCAVLFDIEGACAKEGRFVDVDGEDGPITEAVSGGSNFPGGPMGTTFTPNPGGGCGCTTGIFRGELIMTEWYRGPGRVLLLTGLAYGVDGDVGKVADIGFCPGSADGADACRLGGMECNWVCIVVFAAVGIDDSGVSGLGLPFVHPWTTGFEPGNLNPWGSIYTE